MVSSLGFKYDGHMISGPDARYPNPSMDISCESIHIADYFLWAYYIPKPSDQSGTLVSLDSYNKNESNSPDSSFICPYCSKFSSTYEKEYQRHILLKHPGKSGYPNTVVR
jgi:hypothetical protein